MVSWLSLTSTSSHGQLTISTSGHGQLTIINLYFQSWSADYLYFRSWSADCLYFQSWSADYLNLDFQSWSADYLQPLLQVMDSWLSLTSIWSWLAAYLNYEPSHAPTTWSLLAVSSVHSNFTRQTTDRTYRENQTWTLTAPHHSFCW